MRAWGRFACATLIAMGLSTVVLAADTGRQHLYLCRSPLLAFDFWNTLQEMRTKGVTVTPKIAEEVCNGMRAGNEPQCLRVAADDFKPVASGWGGAMAMSDGKTKVWFHSPDALGWVHPDYYVLFVNSKK